MAEQIKVTTTIPAEPKKVYNAWLTGREHSKMTASKATGSTKVGGRFTAWEGYIKGKNLDLVKNKRIIQTWRSAEFGKDDLDSILVIKFEESKTGSKITLIHSEIPDGQGGSYKSGWKEHYFEPMKKYFGNK